MLLRVVLTGSCGDVAQEAQSTYCLCELHSSNGISPVYVGRKGHLSEVVGGLVLLSGRVSTPLRHILRIEDEYGGTSRRGKPGAPVLVALRLVEAGSCAPIPGALVDMWHTDAAGRYSGFPGQGSDGADTTGETFLRGTQVTDPDGLVEFETITLGGIRGGRRISTSEHIRMKGRLWRSTCIFPMMSLMWSTRGSRIRCGGTVARGIGMMGCCAGIWGC